MRECLDTFLSTRLALDSVEFPCEGIFEQINGRRECFDVPMFEDCQRQYGEDSFWPVESPSKTVNLRGRKPGFHHLREYKQPQLTVQVVRSSESMSNRREGSKNWQVDLSRSALGSHAYSFFISTMDTHNHRTFGTWN
ncbi:hypothetical protein PTI98_004281 [Pleurotus ostreatus]|nr:hypothetical protein PTI98_004281 [Pleurotus ostreatus]